MSLTIRYGKAAEGATLVELQRRASLQWESDRAAVLAHPEVIQLPASQLEEHRVRVAEITGRLAGFSVVIPTTAICWELDGLFVEPDLWGQGVGRALMTDVVQLARDQGVRVMELTANLNAERFYQKLGFISSGEAQTSFGPAIRMHLQIPQ
jgi:GNAT superfamily N-acetyltransferase